MLQALYHQLAELYELDAPHTIADFLITDRTRLASLPVESPLPDSDEFLLISENGEDLQVSLFLDPTVVAGLNAMDDLRTLNRQNIQHFWLAIEGISHFLYLTWRGHRNRSLTRLEMELQAEIDKYLCTIRRLFPRSRPPLLKRLHHLLFEQTRIHQTQPAHLRQRYSDANRYAAKYCHALQTRLHSGSPSGLLNELRRFYRLSQNDKIRYIQTLP